MMSSHFSPQTSLVISVVVLTVSLIAFVVTYRTNLKMRVIGLAISQIEQTRIEIDEHMKLLLAENADLMRENDTLRTSLKKSLFGEAWTELDRARTTIQGMTLRIQQFQESQKVWQAADLENLKLRGLLAKGNDPCIYCSLPAKDMAKCAHGFPGCGRGADLLNDPEFVSIGPDPDPGSVPSIDVQSIDDPSQPLS